MPDPPCQTGSTDGGCCASAWGEFGEAVGAVAGLRGVSFSYVPGVPVIRSVTAGLSSGRVCALIGPNAAGKSTLLKLMLGQLVADEGTVELSGRPVSSWPAMRRAGLVSYVPQHGGVSFAFTVAEVVAMGRYAMGDRGGAVESALELCDLADLRDRVFVELSGGQQQRVLLARAVAQSAGPKPPGGGGGRVMLLDEPASGMDLWHVHQTMRLLVRLARGGVSGGTAGQGGQTECAPGDTPGVGPGVLVVMHDVNLAARYADDIWLMDRGRLVAAGPWRDVLEPRLLGSVYGVRFTEMRSPGPGAADVSGPAILNPGTGGDRRPVFWIDPADTIE
jgi:ABC-type hemin transport system ATPase subunit